MIENEVTLRMVSSDSNSPAFSSSRFFLCQVLGLMRPHALLQKHAWRPLSASQPSGFRKSSLFWMPCELLSFRDAKKERENVSRVLDLWATDELSSDSDIQLLVSISVVNLKFFG